MSQRDYTHVFEGAQGFNMWDYYQFVLTLLKHKVLIMPVNPGNQQVLKKKKKKNGRDFWLNTEEPDVISK